MKFAPAAVHLECSRAIIVGAPGWEGDLRKLASVAVDLLARPGYAIFRIGRLRLGIDDSRRLAHMITDAVCAELVRRGAPAEMRVEQDRPQQTYVPDGYQTRTLLPHHDGQHCSYLTPSLLDDPDWPVEGREFGTSGYTTTPAHKMYQGVFVADPGDGMSVTTYYDWLDVLETVWTERHGDGDSVEPAILARWLGANLRSALRRQPEHGCSYPSIAGMLGLSEPVWNGLSFHHAEAELSLEDRGRFPLAAGLAHRCSCGQCQGATERLFCHQLSAATGRDWSAFRRQWEVLVPSERFDLLFGHNLTELHGGLAGGPNRLIEPFCLVVDRPSGEQYERWLAASWRRTLPDDLGTDHIFA